MDSYDCIEYIPDQEISLTQNTSNSKIISISPLDLPPVVHLYENYTNGSNRICGLLFGLIKEFVIRENLR